MNGQETQAESATEPEPGAVLSMDWFDRIIAIAWIVVFLIMLAAFVQVLFFA